MDKQKKIAIACQGGGSHTAFAAGVLTRLLEEGIDERYQLVGLSGTSGGAICATAAWYGLLKKLGEREKNPTTGWSSSGRRILPNFSGNSTLTWRSFGQLACKTTASYPP